MKTIHSIGQLGKQVTIFSMLKLFPEAIGGAEVFAYRLCKELRRKGWEVNLISLYTGQKIASFYSREGIKISIRYPRIFAPRPLLRLPILIPFSFVSEAVGKSQTILCFSTFSLIFGYPISRLLGKSCVVRFMGSDIYYLDYMPLSLNERLIKIIFQLGFHISKHANRVVVMSSWMKEYLIQKGISSSKVVLIPNGADYAVTPNSESASLTKEILYVGRLSEDIDGKKQIPVLLEAFYRLLKNYPNCHLTLIGDGPDRPRLIKAISGLNLNNSISLTGLLPLESVRNHMERADAFVFPSAMEGMSNSLLEATLMGLPIVATDIPPNRELLSNVEGSLLVSVGSVDEFHKALEILMQDLDGRKRLAISAAKRLRKVFSIDNIATKYETVLSRPHAT